MGFVSQLELHHIARGRADRYRPVQQLARRPAHMGAMRLGHMLIHRGVVSAFAAERMNRHTLIIV